MPDQYDIDYAQQVTELLPPDKRFKTNTAFLTDAMKSTVQYLRDALFGDYRNGSTASAWAAGTYSRGNKVNYKKGIYVSLIDNNTTLPTDPDSWYQQQTVFIGLNERLAYNGNNLILTWALNRWFGTTFRQPNAVSDIYLTINTRPLSIFRFGVTEAISSEFFLDRSTEGIDNNDSSTEGYIDLTINFPVAVYNALDPIDANRQAIIRAFVDQYIYAGVLYQIATY